MNSTGHEILFRDGGGKGIMCLAKLAICSFEFLTLAGIFTPAVGGCTECDHAPRTKRGGIVEHATAPAAGASGTSVQTLQVGVDDSV